MRKKNFLSGIGAKSALAAVALTTMVFTSCEKEEFNIEPVELLPASATVTATVYDIETGKVLNATCTPASTITINAGADGTIAQQTVEITASLQPEYLDNSGSVTIFPLKKGQVAYFPLSIFLQPVSTAVDDPQIMADPNAPVEDEPVTEEIIELTNKDPKAKIIHYYYQAKRGQIVINLAEIEKKIDALQEADGRAASDLTMDQVKAALKAQLISYNQGFTTVNAEGEVEVPAGAIIKVTPVTTYLTTEYTMSAKVNGKIWEIPGVQIKKAAGTVATPGKPEPIDHGHGHGHGDGSNPGGGEGGK